MEWEGLAPGVMEGSGRLGFLYMFFPYMLYSPGEHLAKPDPGGCPLRAQQFGLKKNIYTVALCRLFLVAESQLLFGAVWGLLIAVAPLVAKHRL